MEEVSLEHKKISNLWQQSVFFPELYSLTRDWLSNSRHKGLHIFPFNEIYEILKLASENIDEFKKNIELIEMCSFHLNEEYVEITQKTFSDYKYLVSVKSYKMLENFIEFSKETRFLIETHMAETYALKKRSDLIFLLNDEYYENTIHKDIIRIQFLLFEVKYNILLKDPEDSILIFINQAIGLTKNLIETQSLLIKTLKRKMKLDAQDLAKHLSVENRLLEIIIEIKKMI